LTLYPLEKSYVEAHQLIALHQLSRPHGAIYAVTKQDRLTEDVIQTFVRWLQQQLEHSD
jgi:DNA-binding transcriptional LysR family regulator